MHLNIYNIILKTFYNFLGQNEIAESIRSVSKGVKDGVLQENDITGDLINRSLYTEDSVAPDLVIRTSGEIRISDFMLWQSSFSCLYFTPVLWPEFTLWELLKAIFHYQRSYNTLNELRKTECEVIRNERTEKYLSDLYFQRFNQMKKIVS